MTTQRTMYDKEFKQKLVELARARGNAKQIVEEYGVSPELLYRWRREAQKYEHPIPSREFILDFLSERGRPAIAEERPLD